MDAGVTSLLSDPFLRAYKDDPRFIAFGQKIGVMPKAAPKRLGSGTKAPE